jgi:hypothetical protein
MDLIKYVYSENAAVSIKAPASASRLRTYVLYINTNNAQA